MQKQPFPVGGGSKRFEDWGKEGGLKILGLGVIDLGGYFSWGGVSTPLYAMCTYTQLPPYSFRVDLNDTYSDISLDPRFQRKEVRIKEEK